MEGLQGRILAQLRDSDTPFITICLFEKTQDGVPSCVNAVYHARKKVKLHHLLPLDGASNVVNEEDQEARPALISMGLTIPRECPHLSCSRSTYATRG